MLPVTNSAESTELEAICLASTASVASLVASIELSAILPVAIVLAAIFPVVTEASARCSLSILPAT